MTRVLVAGTYPPVPGPASQATLDAVRAAVAGGAEVEVVSWRPSAAHHVGTLGGAGGAFTLERLRRRRAMDQLVLCTEPGLPFPQGAGRLRNALTTLCLRAVLRRFDTVELVVDGELDMAGPMAALLGAGRVTVCRRRPPVGGSVSPHEVTPQGPPEWVRGERMADLRERLDHRVALVDLAVARLARAALGDHAVRLGPLRRLTGPLRMQGKDEPGQRPS